MKRYRHTTLLGLAIFLGLAGYVAAQQVPQYLRIENNGTLLTRRPVVNFIGSGSGPCADNFAQDRTDCTVSGGGGGGVTLTAGQIGFGGSTANTVVGSNKLTWTDSSSSIKGGGVLQLEATNGGTFNPSVAMFDNTGILRLAGGTVTAIGSTDDGSSTPFVVDTDVQFSTSFISFWKNNGAGLMALSWDGGLSLSTSSASPQGGSEGTIRYDGAHWQISNDGATWDDIATGSSGNRPFFRNAEWASKIASTAGAAAGDYSTGAKFTVDSNATILGVRWYQQAGLTASVTAKLWNASTNTALASVTVTPTANAINTAMFGTPYALSVADVQYSITVRDGTNQLLYMGGGSTDPGIQIGPWGPNLYMFGGGYAAGDSGALSTGHYNGIEPIYTVP